MERSGRKSKSTVTSAKKKKKTCQELITYVDKRLQKQTFLEYCEFNESYRIRTETHMNKKINMVNFVHIG